MTYKILLALCITSFLFSCTHEYSCSDPQIRMAFVGFGDDEIDTLVLIKYAANGNFQAPLDSFTITNPLGGQFTRSADTVSVFPANFTKAIYAGFDWKVFIPGNSRTFAITNIASERRKGKCGTGLFSMDKVGCVCNNNVFSATVGGTTVNFPDVTVAPPTIYLRN